MDTVQGSEPKPGQRNRADLFASLIEMRPDQVMLRTLEARGWTIPHLCDLIIDGFPPDVSDAVQYEIEQRIIHPEWVIARRTERAHLALAASIALLDDRISKIDETIGRLSGTVATLAAVLNANSAQSESSSGKPKKSIPPGSVGAKG